MFYDIAQNTDEWLDMRARKVTGSAISCIMANYGKAFGEPAKKYAINLAVERLRGERIQGDRYTNKHMEAGHIEEPVARMLYELKTGDTVVNGGFYDNGKTGCSPDGGILFEPRGVEIKSVIPSTHYKTDKKKTFDSTYKWQFMFNLKETSWDQLDYVSYCEQYTKDKQLLIVPILAKDHQEEFDMIDMRLEKFEALIQECTNIITDKW